MKTLSYLFISAAIFLSACSSTRQTSDVYHDDYPGAKKKAQQVAASIQSRDQNREPGSSDNNYEYYSNENSSQNTQSTTDSEGNTYVTNNYYNSSFNSDDYYDYSYTARIRRFYYPTWGLSYFDNYYTDLYYYTYDPFYWGTSIYLGYNWWTPSYTHWGLGWGWGWNDWYPRHYYGGWGSPDPWDWSYGRRNSYWRGYNHGYWNGFYDGYYGNVINNTYYYNSFDRTSHYYGPRQSISTNSVKSYKKEENSNSSNSKEPSRQQAPNWQQPFSAKYEKAIAAEKMNNKEAVDIKENFTPTPATKRDPVLENNLKNNSNWNIEPEKKSGVTKESMPKNYNPTVKNKSFDFNSKKLEKPSNIISKPALKNDNVAPKEYSKPKEINQPKKFDSGNIDLKDMPTKNVSPKSYDIQPKQKEYQTPKNFNNPPQQKQVAPKNYNKPSYNSTPRSNGNSSGKSYSSPKSSGSSPGSYYGPRK